MTKDEALCFITSLFESNRELSTKVAALEAKVLDQPAHNISVMPCDTCVKRITVCRAGLTIENKPCPVYEPHTAQH